MLVNTAYSDPHVCCNMTFKNHVSHPFINQEPSPSEDIRRDFFFNEWFRVRPWLLTRWKREGISIYKALMSQTLSYTLDSFSQLNLSTHLKGKNHYSYCSSERGHWYHGRYISLRMFKELEVLNRGFRNLKYSLCARRYLNVLFKGAGSFIFHIQERASDCHSSINSQMVSLCSSLPRRDVQGQPGS